MSADGTNGRSEGRDEDQGGGQANDGDLEGMAVDVSSNQIRNEDIPASHHEDKGQQSVAQNEEHAHGSARHEDAASSRDENSGN